MNYKNQYLNGSLVQFGENYRKKNFMNYELLPKSEKDRILSEMPEYIDSLNLSTKAETDAAIKKYYKDHQPKITYENYDKVKAIVLDAVEPRVEKLASKLVNAVGDFDDFVSELNIKVLTVLENNKDNYIKGGTEYLDNEDISDIVHIVLVAINNYQKDLSVDFSSRPDTSIFHASDHYTDNDGEDTDADFADEDNDFGQITFVGPEEMAVAGNLLEKLVRELRFDETPLMGKDADGNSYSKGEIGDLAIRFIKECIDPSPSLEQRHKEWLENPNTKIKIQDKIPQRLVCEEIGIDFDKDLTKIKEAIGFSLVALGVNVRKVFSKEYLTMSKQWWLKHGCNPPSGVTYNDRGEVLKVA